MYVYMCIYIYVCVCVYMSIETNMNKFNELIGLVAFTYCQFVREVEVNPSRVTMPMY